MISSQTDRESDVLVVVPTYNNERTIATVVQGVKEFAEEILVVNDGSTDATEEILEGIEKINVIGYKKNRGKGYALRQALKYAGENGYRYMITIDSDGQHYPENIVTFLEEVEQNPDSLIIGARNLNAENMPSKNSFANKFSNFWFWAETGMKMSDTQSGYRLYPVKKLQGMRFFTNRYEFELEIIVRAVWRGIQVKNCPIKVYYPPQEERVSHFRPSKDFTRISLLNSLLVTAALLYYFPLHFMKKMTWGNIRKFFDQHLIHSKESNLKMALSMGLGVFFGIVPLWGYQMISAGVAAHFLRLNKVIAVLWSNISIPPMIPFILYGSYLTGALFLEGELSLSLSDMTLSNLRRDLIQYIVGSFIFATFCGVITTVGSYLIMLIFRKEPAHE